MFIKSHLGLLLISALFCLYACASPKAPTGGLKDSKPPVIIEKESTPNKQTNFHEKEITILFDEWITMKDVYTQLVVSPLMPHDPDIKQKGKGIIIRLPDSLKAETTYTINFGNSIADLNEGNILENYSFIFSTGDNLDSIRLTGIVTNALTLKPADGVWVMLYPVGEDSAVYKRKPEYLAKTNKDGRWTMSNVRGDSFNIVALKDDNQNFLYDQEGELFGWRDSTVFTSQPLVQISELRVFPRENRNVIKEIFNVAPGRLKVVINAPYPKQVPVFVPAIDSSMMIWDGDTLQVYYNPAKNYGGYAILENDSTKIKASSSPSLVNKPAGIRISSVRLRPGSQVSIISELPLLSVDTSRIKLSQDSFGIIPYKIEKDIHDIRRFDLSAGWIEKMRYHLTLLPGAITDYWGRSNDTVKQILFVTGPDQYGDLTMTIDGLDSSKQYVLLIKAGEQISDTFVIEHQSATQLVKKGLSPGKYTLELIEDLNQNGVWDTGDYHKKRQPERKMIFMPDNLRAGWELEAKVTWNLK
ncbi:MAG: Ig-like domain-containing protein [Saprospiraceae bacterium]|uniref:Ig-like domain-containing protein n=1 Tax=Candidatus Opimibacter skivensis TaxID=2982028 RepID=A0A9D7SXA7_9BACT|nr:Ig-like domain-containing protein [Candidatus Opimibacter skivensis]